MKWFKENIFELILLIGILFLSIGFFNVSLQVGFISTGAILVILSLSLWKASQEGGD